VPWEPDSQSPQRSKLVAWVASPDKLWGNPNALRVRQSPLSGDPPAALVSPGPSVGKPSSRTGSLRERPSPTAGNPLRLRSAPYACGTATPIGASCTPVPWLGGNPTASRHNGGNPNARCLRRETRLQHWLRKALLWAGGWLHNALNPTPFGYACGTPRANASRLGRETLSEVATTRGTRARHNSWQRWSHQIPLSGNPHQVLAPSGFTSRLRRETRLQRWIHRKAQLLAALDSPQGAALGTEVAHERNPTKSAGLTRCLGRETVIKHWTHR
jgi:hypothetical protein